MKRASLVTGFGYRRKRSERIRIMVQVGVDLSRQGLYVWSRKNYIGGSIHLRACQETRRGQRSMAARRADLEKG
jgi:hypothetical protein